MMSNYIIKQPYGIVVSQKDHEEGKGPGSFYRKFEDSDQERSREYIRYMDDKRYYEYELAEERKKEREKKKKRLKKGESEGESESDEENDSNRNPKKSKLKEPIEPENKRNPNLDLRLFCIRNGSRQRTHELSLAAPFIFSVEELEYIFINTPQIALDQGRELFTKYPHLLKLYQLTHQIELNKQSRKIHFFLNYFMQDELVEIARKDTDIFEKYPALNYFYAPSSSSSSSSPSTPKYKFTVKDLVSMPRPIALKADPEDYCHLLKELTPLDFKIFLAHNKLLIKKYYPKAELSDELSILLGRDWDHFRSKFKIKNYFDDTYHRDGNFRLERTTKNLEEFKKILKKYNYDWFIIREIANNNPYSSRVKIVDCPHHFLEICDKRMIKNTAVGCDLQFNYLN